MDAGIGKNRRNASPPSPALTALPLAPSTFRGGDREEWAPIRASGREELSERKSVVRHVEKIEGPPELAEYRTHGHRRLGMEDGLELVDELVGHRPRAGTVALEQVTEPLNVRGVTLAQSAQ